MARGWESKSVEAQQEDAFRKAAIGAGRQITQDDRDREGRRRVMVLARARTADQLANATAPAQQEMLTRALADLDRVIDDLT
jgi:hypothetical protein